MTRFEKHATFAQKWCKEKYKHPVIEITDVHAGGKKVTIAWCNQCGWMFFTTRGLLKRYFKSHDPRA